LNAADNQPKREVVVISKVKVDILGKATNNLSRGLKNIDGIVGTDSFIRLQNNENMKWFHLL
jgi:hypothetical protein